MENIIKLYEEMFAGYPDVVGAAELCRMLRAPIGYVLALLDAGEIAQEAGRAEKKAVIAWLCGGITSTS